MSRPKDFTFRPRGKEHIELFRAGRLKGTIDLIYWHPFALRRHREAPLLKEREEFLVYLLKRGTVRASVQFVAGMLLRAIKALDPKKALRPLGLKDIDRATEKIWGRAASCDSTFPGFHAACVLKRCFRVFLRFHGKLKTRKSSRPPFAEQLDSFAEYSRSRNLLPISVESDRLRTQSFLEWYALRSNNLSNISIRHIGRFIVRKKADGWASRLRTCVSCALLD